MPPAPSAAPVSPWPAARAGRPDLLRRPVSTASAHKVFHRVADRCASRCGYLWITADDGSARQFTCGQPGGTPFCRGSSDKKAVRIEERGRTIEKGAFSVEAESLSEELPKGIGFGLAAVGRPGYINVGREGDLPPGRGVDAMRERSRELLDYAYEHGVRYFDVARSYGRAEEFLAQWLMAGGRRPGVVVGSKWGYTYTAGWRVDAETHEVKDHSVATYDRQIAETRQLLDGRLNLYQVHSVTPGSPVLTDTVLHRRLAALAAEGVTVGVSTSGPQQPEAIRAALDVTVDGTPLFRSIQATWNLIEPSAGPALAEAHDAGCLVIVKEAMANGRLARPGPATEARLAPLAERTGASYDALALAATLHQPWSHVVLSGAATTAQLAANLRATAVRLAGDELARLLADLAEIPETYWSRRAGLPWN
jgi:aryl-alcohol dehydrogenase-like predicted oxidoreductase